MKAVRAANQFLVNQGLFGNFISPILDIQQVDLTSLQLNYSGSPNGIITIQGSLDQDNWSDLYVSVDGNTPQNTIDIPSNSSPIFIDMSTCASPFLRIGYTSLGGSGEMQGFAFSKRIGD